MLLSGFWVLPLGCSEFGSFHHVPSKHQLHIAALFISVGSHIGIYLVGTLCVLARYSRSARYHQDGHEHHSSKLPVFLSAFLFLPSVSRLNFFPRFLSSRTPHIHILIHFFTKVLFFHFPLHRPITTTYTSVSIGPSPLSPAPFPSLSSTTKSLSHGSRSSQDSSSPSPVPGGQKGAKAHL